MILERRLVDQRIVACAAKKNGPPRAQRERVVTAMAPKEYVVFHHRRDRVIRHSSVNVGHAIADQVALACLAVVGKRVPIVALTGSVRVE